jgi:hypothetical protein
VQPQAEPEGDGERSTEDVSPEMHELKNCCLLEKSFNISKGAAPLSTFLRRLGESRADAKKTADWAKDLGIDDTLLDPRRKPPADIRAAIQARSAAMRGELEQYLAGTRQRVDI